MSLRISPDEVCQSSYLGIRLSCYAVLTKACFFLIPSQLSPKPTDSLTVLVQLKPWTCVRLLHILSWGEEGGTTIASLLSSVGLKIKYQSNNYFRSASLKVFDSTSLSIPSSGCRIPFLAAFLSFHHTFVSCNLKEHKMLDSLARQRGGKATTESLMSPIKHVQFPHFPFLFLLSNLWTALGRQRSFEITAPRSPANAAILISCWCVGFIQNSSLCACADAQTQLWVGQNRSWSILHFGTEHGNVAVCCVSSVTALEGLMGGFFSLSMLLVRPGSGSYMRQLEDSRYQKLLFRRNGCVRSPLQNCWCRSVPRHQLDGEMAAFEPASLGVVKTKYSIFNPVGRELQRCRNTSFLCVTVLDNCFLLNLSIYFFNYSASSCRDL